MKKNLSLLGILILLIIVTWFFQEKRLEEDKINSDLRDRLITSDISHLKLPRLEAEKRNNQWLAGQDLLSHNTLKLIEKKLKDIKKLKEVSGDWNSFFPNPFSFEINHERWTIGDLSLDKQGFYIARDKKIFLAYIDGESHDLARDENEIAAIKLDELVRALSAPIENLKETQLFRYFTDLPLDKVLLDVMDNLPFEIDFMLNETSPPPIKGVRVHRDLRGKFYSLLTQVTLREEVPYSDKLKVKKLGTLTFLSGQRKLTWELWLKGLSSADAVILVPELKRAFLMSGGTLKVFFVRNQEYWDKKVIPQENFVSFSRLETTFKQGPKSARLTILNREPLQFEARGFQVDQATMELLIQIILNLGPKDQADRVSILSKSEEKQLVGGDHLRLSLMGQELLLWRKQEELIVANLTQGFKAHFHLLDEKFRGRFEDVLK
jgi:hypothetical protein